MVELTFHSEAKIEYAAAFVRYQTRSPNAAARFEAEMERVLTSIRTNPELFPSYDDDCRFAVLKRFPFVVIFQILLGQIYIVAVAYSSRAQGYWQDRI